MRLTLLLLFLCIPSWASYRVYRLRIRHFDHKGKPTKVEMVTSSLDPYQHEHYHGGYRWTKVELVDTWYCPGDTSKKLFCAKPKVIERYPADTESKRSALPYHRQPYIP